MKKHIVAVSLSAALLAGCGESQEEAAPVDAAPAVDLAAGTGPYLVSYADGTETLNFASEDGTEYSGATPGPEHGTWSMIDGRACLDPPGDAEDGSPNVTCVTSGEVADDGSWTVMPDGAEESATIRRLDDGPVGEMGAGSYLIDFADGTQALGVWTESGDAYVTFEPSAGSWRVVDGQRCTTAGDGTESCGAPTSEMAEDGSFTAEDDANGSFTVRML